MIQEDNVIGFEAAGAGVWEVFGTIVVNGVVGYADSHQYESWRGYSAARAALCAAAMIEEINLPDKRRASGSETSASNSSEAFSDGGFFVIPERREVRLIEKNHASGGVTAKERARRLEMV